MLPKDAVLEFKQLYEAKYQDILSFKEAEIMANKLFNMLKLVTVKK